MTNANLAEAAAVQVAADLLAELDRAKNENLRLRMVLAYEARVAEAHFEGYKTYPKTRRPYAEEQVVRMRDVAVGNWPDHYIKESVSLNRALRNLEADPLG